MSESEYSSDGSIDGDDLKLFNTLMKIERDVQYGAEEILNAILCSSDDMDWHEDTLELIVEGRKIRKTNIIDLVEYLCYSENGNIENPHGLKIFIEALKNIGLDSEWVKNESIAKYLEKSESDASSSSGDEDSDEKSSEQSEIDDSASRDEGNVNY